MLCHTPDQDSSFFLKVEKFVAMWQLELERSVRVMFIIFHSVHSKPWALCLGFIQ